MAASAGGEPASAPACVAPALDRSARLPGTPLLVTPAPGGLDAMPQTQISLLGAPARELAGVVVRGSATGLHRGRLEPYSQGDGASFVPRRPFAVGETVDVSGSWSAAGVRHPFAYSFTIGDPDRVGPPPVPTKPAGPPGSVLHFRSAPALTPAALTVTTTSAAARRDGDIFLATYPGPGTPGPAIYAPSGRLVWFAPLHHDTFATNVRVQRYRGAGGPDLVAGHDLGARLRPRRGRDLLALLPAARNGPRRRRAPEDLHELTLTAGGSALITAWKPLRCDLAANGGRADAAVYDTVLQEIDIRTGLVRYEWDSLEHVR